MECKIMKNCKTCKHAKWERNEKGNLLPSRYGICSFDVKLEQLKIPWCMEKPSTRKVVIWPKNGENCPCFEPKPKTPKP